MILLALDPSLSCSGWALFYDGVLSSCGIAPTETRWAYNARIVELARVIARDIISRNRIDRVVIEWPQVYEGEQRKGRPEDLLWLAAVSGAALTAINMRVVMSLVKPSEWKGQVEKKTHNERVLKRLTDPERWVLDSVAMPSALRNNAIDAIGIGLKDLGRLEAKRGERNLEGTTVIPAGRRATRK